MKQYFLTYSKACFCDLLNFGGESGFRISFLVVFSKIIAYFFSAKFRPILSLKIFVGAAPPNVFFLIATLTEENSCYIFYYIHYILLWLLLQRFQFGFLIYFDCIFLFHLLGCFLISWLNSFNVPWICISNFLFIM